tara:strand:- start:638 stop:814 length:177 start_codon:yes stop_codon:yes gene_type:complete
VKVIINKNNKKEINIMRTEKEIREVLAVEKETWSDGNQTDMVIKGWIEALEYVLGGEE